MKYITVRIILFGIVVLMNLIYLYYSDIHPFVVSQSCIRPQCLIKQNDQLWRGEFTAEYDHLGAVAFELQTNSEQPVKNYLFEIKDKTSKRLHYIARLYGNPFYKGLFAFGFPLIANSKGRLYEYTLSISQAKSNHTSIKSTPSFSPHVIAKYKYPLTSFLEQPKDLVHFIAGKLIFAYTYKLFFIQFFGLLYIYLILFSTFISKKIHAYLHVSLPTFIVMYCYVLYKQYYPDLLIIIFLSVYIFIDKDNMKMQLRRVAVLILTSSILTILNQIRIANLIGVCIFIDLFYILARQILSQLHIIKDVG